MSTRPTSLGRCPHCGTDIDSADALISYERDGDTTHYAECPACLTVVRPE